MYSVYVPWFFTMGVPSFGNPRIEAYLQLPAAYRSLSRPSSAPDAKAFTLCSCSLELPSFKSTSRSTLFSRSYLNCLSFIQNMDNCFSQQLGFPSCFVSLRLTDYSVLTKLFYPDWKDLISQSLSKSRFVFVLSICFFILNLCFIRFSMSTNSHLSLERCLHGNRTPTRKRVTSFSSYEHSL